MRILSWNIYHGGNGISGPENLGLLAEFAAAQRPDIFCCIETYGAAPMITAELSRQARKPFRGHQITQLPDGQDNLWIFTHYPVLSTYRPTSGDSVSDFNLGGVHAQLPDGSGVNVFVTWLEFRLDPVDLIERTFHPYDQSAPPTTAEVADCERPQRQNMRDILSRQLPAAVGDSTDPIVIAGDLNTESHLDWNDPDASAVWRRLGGEWEVSQQLDEAGFDDAYRLVHPDPSDSPGSTWSPLDANLARPHRIDFAYVSRSGLSVDDARILHRPNPRHRTGPFYSDHAAVLIDLHR